MDRTLEPRRIGIFIAFAFGIAWLAGLVVYLTGGLANSPMILPGLSLAFLLVTVVYMMAPALANVLTRLVTREGWKDLWLRPQLRRGWPYWLAALFLPPLLTGLGALFYFLLFPAQFDPTLSSLRLLLPAGAENMNPWLLLVLMVLQSVLIGAVVNSLFTFGEEFGWRAYLLQKLLPLGTRKALLVLGAIWGVWHWPVIAMGHNYGMDYVGYPWLGMLAMVWFTFVLGVLLSWATLKAGSVWPAVLGHAVINASAATPTFLLAGSSNTLLGPLPTGLIASFGFTLFALWVLARPPRLEMPEV